MPVRTLVDLTNNAPAFSSLGDAFGILQRPDGPFAVLDDSLSIFPTDSQGIIGEGNTDKFFGIVDTENDDNSGPVSARWTFDIAGFADLGLSIDDQGDRALVTVDPTGDTPVNSIEVAVTSGIGFTIGDIDLVTDVATS